MTIKRKLQILMQYPLFDGFHQDKLLLLAGNAKEKLFPRGSIILNQNEATKEVLFIYEGLISIYILNANGKSIPIRTKGPMYIVGELNIVDNQPNTTIEAIQETKALGLRISDMQELLLAYPIFGSNLLKMVVEKLRVANTKAEYYFSTPLKQRTWSTLEAIASHFPNREIALSQEKLADNIGATRAKVAEVLQELQNEKAISLAYRKIQVL